MSDKLANSEWGEDLKRRLWYDPDPHEACDKTEFLSALDTLYSELSYFDYSWVVSELDLYYYDIATEYGDDWQCGENYLPVLKKYVCDHYCASICRDPLENKFAEWKNELDRLQIYSEGGPRAAEQRDAVCADDSFGPASGECAYFTRQVPPLQIDGRVEAPIREFITTVQRAFANSP